MTDYVFTYVDSEDNNWYEKFKNIAIKSGRSSSKTNVRWRSWGTLKYLLRGIAENLPFINNLYMIVSDMSQVPSWINKEKVHIILHKDIIPNDYLPTYNSNTIEMFMYKIPGLSEQFIYGNDDMFPIGLMKESDFFENGKPLIACRTKNRPIKMTIYRRSLVRTLQLCLYHNRYTFDKDKYVRSDHSINPMLKSTWEMYHTLYKQNIYNTLSVFREPNNVTQELSNFHHYINNLKNGISTKFPVRRVTYFEFKHKTAERLRPLINDKTKQILCMNDAGVLDYNAARKIVCEIFDKRFPNKCKYEI